MRTIGARGAPHTGDALLPVNDLAASLSTSQTSRHLAALSVPRHARHHQQFPPPPPLGIVVAHFDEDLDWLHGHENETTVYCKGTVNDDHSRARSWVHLPNIGCESHTYLHHIVHNYQNLPDMTLFAQGRIEDSVEDFVDLDALLQRMRDSSTDMVLFRGPYTFDEWGGMRHLGKWEWELNEGVMRRADVSPGDFWAWMFHGAPPPERINWVHASTFAVRRRAIERHPWSFYKRLLDRFDAINHPKPEEGHYMERFFMSIFGFSHGVHDEQDPGFAWWQQTEELA